MTRGPPDLGVCARATGSVFDVMAVTGKPLDLYATARVGLHTCRGMAYLHGFNPKIIHRDLKCANLLLDKQWTVKCADFGLSRELMSAATTRVGSVQWAAPEILRGEQCVVLRPARWAPRSSGDVCLTVRRTTLCSCTLAAAQGTLRSATCSASACACGSA